MKLHWMALALAGAIVSSSPARADSLDDAVAAQPLIAIEKQRAAIVQRVVAEWGYDVAGLPSGRRMSHEQFSQALFGLRADRLLAARLAGSLSAVETILADHRDDGASPRRAAPKHLGDATADLPYTPINPCRIADTRNAGGALVANVARTFDGFSTDFSTQGGTASGCGVPNGVAALAMNVYAVNPTNLGFIKLWPANSAEPSVSTVNYQTGIVAIATGTIVPVDTANSNRFVAKSPAGVDLIVDVVGYFRPPGDAAGLNVLVAGQRAVRYEPNVASPDVIGGDSSNAIVAGVAGAAIAGGGAPGGSVNVAGQAGLVCDPFGGLPQVCANRVYDSWGAVAGGVGNAAGNNTGAINDAPFASVGGGRANAATAIYSTIAGGERNFASGQRSVVAGGNNNVASNNKSAVVGGEVNTAAGFASTAAGGSNNRASGDYSLAAGRRAKTQTAGGSPVVHNGAFVWADSSNFDFNSAATNEFAARATGGVRFVTAIDGGGAATSFVSFDTNGNVFATGAFNPASDAAVKTAFADISVREVLDRVVAMPIRSWAYKTAPGVRHIGPTAQDFKAAFDVGLDDKHIATVDADGVALAAIQALAAELRSRDARIGELEQAVRELARRLAAP